MMYWTDIKILQDYYAIINKIDNCIKTNNLYLSECEGCNCANGTYDTCLLCKCHCCGCSYESYNLCDLCNGSEISEDRMNELIYFRNLCDCRNYYKYQINNCREYKGYFLNVNWFRHSSLQTEKTIFDKINEIGWTSANINNMIIEFIRLDNLIINPLPEFIYNDINNDINNILQNTTRLDRKKKYFEFI
jgi:hypothetical protein